MTSDSRNIVRLAQDSRARLRVAAEVADAGLDFCERCDREIEDQKPRKRFCSDTCRKRCWNAHTRQGRRQHAAAKVRYRNSLKEAA